RDQVNAEMLLSRLRLAVCDVSSQPKSSLAPRFWGMRVGRGLHGEPFSWSLEPSADERPFFKIEIAVFHHRGVFPILKNPFFATNAFFGERRVDCLWPTPCLEHLLF